MDVKIYPLLTGYIELDKGAYVTPGRDYGMNIHVPTWAYLISGGNEKILVDTGMSETRSADWHHPGSYQPDGLRIDEQLSKLGVGVNEVNAVIFTHLHWDHCSNMKLFENADFYAHIKEVQFALDPHVLYYKSYSSKRLGVIPPFEGINFRTVDSEYRYNDFITMFPTPGHCPGHQSVAVDTSSGVYVIAGDAVFADENMQPDHHRNLPFTPMGRYVNVFEMFDSMELVFRKANHILTAHGNKVSEKQVYP